MESGEEARADHYGHLDLLIGKLISSTQRKVREQRYRSSEDIGYDKNPFVGGVIFGMTDVGKNRQYISRKLRELKIDNIFVLDLSDLPVDMPASEIYRRVDETLYNAGNKIIVLDTRGVMERYSGLNQKFYKLDAGWISKQTNGEAMPPPKKIPLGTLEDEKPKLPEPPSPLRSYERLAKRIFGMPGNRILVLHGANGYYHLNRAREAAAANGSNKKAEPFRVLEISGLRTPDEVAKQAKAAGVRVIVVDSRPGPAKLYPKNFEKIELDEWKKQSRA
jgi:hypothetical protein